MKQHKHYKRDPLLMFTKFFGEMYVTNLEINNSLCCYPILVAFTWRHLTCIQIKVYDIGCTAHDKITAVQTRSTRRAQTSAAPSLRGVKQFIKACNSLVNCYLCTNFSNIHPSLHNVANTYGSRKSKHESCIQGLNGSSPKYSRLFLVW